MPASSQKCQSQKFNTHTSLEIAYEYILCTRLADVLQTESGDRSQSMALSKCGLSSKGEKMRIRLNRATLIRTLRVCGEQNERKF
jgi:hypothetical protein